MSDLRARAEAIFRLMGAATPAPWYSTDRVCWHAEQERNGDACQVPHAECATDEDAAYIAASHTQTDLIRDLLDELEGLRHLAREFLASADASCSADTTDDVAAMLHYAATEKALRAAIACEREGYERGVREAAEKCERRACSLPEGSGVARQCGTDILALLTKDKT